MRRPLLLLLGAAAAAAVGLAVGALAPGSSARLRRARVQDAVRLPAGARREHALPGDRSVGGAIVLRSRDAGALTGFIARAADPSSPDYGHYLRRGAFGARFGPARATREAIAAALRDSGLRVTPDADPLLVRFRGPAAAAERAFGTRIEEIRLPGGGEGQATTAPVSLPADLAGSVAGVVGLDRTLRPRRIGAPTVVRTRSRSRHRRRRSARVARVSDRGNGPRACPAAQRAAVRDGGLTDDAIASAYGADGLYAAGDTGAGQRIALYELEPFLTADVRRFDTCYFGATRARAMLARLHVVPVDGGQPKGAGSGEASLDVEDLSALAPGAQIDVYVGPSPGANPSTFDALDEYAAIVDADRDGIVSSSWGLCEQAVQRGQPGLQEAENLLFQQAAAQGQTVFAAAGDNGADDCNVAESAVPASGQNPVSVDDPASQPYVLGVGGTAIDDASSARPLQHVWNDGAAYGAGGGGISAAWQMPAWQAAARVRGIARPGDATYRAANRVEHETGYPTGFCAAHVAGATPATPCRLVPDLAAEADEFTGAITVFSRSEVSSRDRDGWTTTGGTSSATPIWAAALALVDASASCATQAPGGRRGVGFAAPSLYGLASDPSADRASFGDVTRGNNDVYGLAGGRVFAATRGYDLATGLGTPRLTAPGGRAGLAAHLCAAARSPARPAVTAVRPASGPARGGETVTVHGTGFAAGVAAVQIGSWRVGVRALHVLGPHTLRLTLPPARRTVPPLVTAGQTGAGPAPVLVASRDGQTSAPSPAARFTYDAASGSPGTPTVGAVLPSGGPQAGGRTITILGTGFRGARSVSLGGVRVRRFRVLGPGRISAVTPTVSAHTTCAPLSRHGAQRHETHADDVCQAGVRVRTPSGVSARARIRPPFEGATGQDALGDLRPPAGCRCEVAPAAAEYDYLPRPRITAISTSLGPAALASEHGGTIVTIGGRGLNPLALDWADVGDPRLYASVDVAYAYLSGTTMQIRIPARAVTASVAPVAFSVRTLAGQSAPITLRYAGVPVVTRVRDLAHPRTLHGLAGAPASGGAPLAISGRGFAGQLIGLQYLGAGGGAFSLGTQYAWRPRGDRRLSTRTVAENPAVVRVQPCTVTGCPPPSRTRSLLLYPPGVPSVTALTPASGPASGGTRVTVAGENLGCPIAVRFGSTPAPTYTPTAAVLQCGSTRSLTATAPAGLGGAAVPVTVQTAAGYYDHTAPRTTARFHYR